MENVINNRLGSLIFNLFFHIIYIYLKKTINIKTVALYICILEYFIIIIIFYYY